jgi:hypothetical protein
MLELGEACVDDCGVDRRLRHSHDARAERCSAVTLEAAEADRAASAKDVHFCRFERAF